MVVLQPETPSQQRVLPPGPERSGTAYASTADGARLLAEASRILGASLQIEEVLAGLARLAVPRFADWCVIDLVTDAPGHPRRVAAVHVNPEKAPLVEELRRRFPPDPSTPNPMMRVLKSGEPVLLSEVSDEFLRAATTGEDHYRLLTSLGLRSAMVIPLLASAGGPAGCVGAIAFVSAENGRTYTAHDLAFAEDLGRLAGLAVANARLYEEAAASRRRLKDLVDSVEGILWEANADPFRITFVSQRAEALLGYPASAWTSDPDFWSEHLHPDDRATVVASRQAETREGRDHESEYRMVAADGRLVWFRETVLLQRDGAGRPATLRGLMVDVTARKQADQRLAAQHAAATLLAGADVDMDIGRPLLEAVASKLGWELAVLWTPDREAAVLRPAALWTTPSLVGSSLEEHTRSLALPPGEGLPGRVWERNQPVWINDLPKQEGLPRAGDAARAGIHTALAFPISTARGFHGVIECFTRDRREPDGELLRALAVIGAQAGVFLERKASEASLREMSQIRGAILSASLDAIVTIDHLGNVVEWNPSAEETFGYTRKEAIGREMAELIVPPALRDAHRRGLARFLATGHGAAVGKRLDMTAVRRDGTEFPVELAIVPLETTPPRFTGFLRDITATRERDRELQRLVGEISAQRIRLDNIIGSVPGVVWEAWGSPDAASQRMDFVSDHVERMLGYTKAEWLSRPNFWLSIVHPADRERAARESHAIFLSGKSGIVRFRWVAKDGSALWVEAHSVSILDEEGRPAGMRGVTLDVTERVRAERALRVSDERFHLLARATSDVIWDWDLKAESLWWNENFQHTFGYAPEDIEPGLASWSSRIHPDDLDRVLHGIHDALGGPALTWSDEYRFRRKDGAYAPVYDRGIILRAPDGTPQRMIGSMLDLADIRATEEALRESEARYRFLADTVPQQVWTAGPDGRLDYVNRRVLEYFGLAPEAIVGEGWHALAHPEDLPRVLERWSLSLATGQPYEVEYRLRHANGAYRWHIGRALPQRDGDGRIIKWFGANADIQDIKEAEETLRLRSAELARIADSLARSNHELDQFAYVTSHDLKAPLRGIANLSRWIEEDLGQAPIPQDVRNHLDLLRGRVNRMESLIDAILEYSRVGRVQANPEAVDTGTLVKEVVDLLSPPPGFRLELPEDMPTLHTERLRLQQVFQNLIGNAIKHHPRKEAAIVTLLTEDQGDRVRFSVRDNGHGIPKRFHDRIFQIFQTLEARDKVEGTGIGLAIVKKVVEAKGGRVEVASEEGEGTTFSFTWPKHEEVPR